MDLEFESTLLAMIDEFSGTAEPSADQFREFKFRFQRYLFERTTEATRAVEARFPDASLRDWVGPTEAGLELERVANDQLPADRRIVFSFIAERASWTASTSEPTDLERRYGWASISDFVNEVRDKRSEYRARFGR
jgi:hypothetical protein